jgi:hypothetical protein
MSELKKILNSYSAAELKRFISKSNITGYSKMKKNDIMELMMRVEHKHKFKNIKMKEPKKKEPKKVEPKEEPKKVEPKETPKKVMPKKVEPKEKPKKVMPKFPYLLPKKVEPKKVEPKKEMPKKVEPKEPLPKPVKVNPELKPLQTIVKELLKYDRGDPVDFECYYGMTWFLYLYVLQKHKNDCVWNEEISGEKDLSKKIDEKNLFLFNLFGSKVGLNLASLTNIEVQERIMKKYLECAKRNKILVIPLTLPGHANMLVFNHKLRQVERYEPHGSGTQGKIQKPLDNALKSLAELIAKDKTTPNFTQGFRFSPSEESCPIIPKDFKIYAREGAGLQSYDGTLEQKQQKIRVDGDLVKDTEGFCCMWSFLQMDYRLSNPTLKPNKLGTELMKAFKENPRESFRRFIRGYTSEFLDYLKKNLGGIKNLTKLYKSKGGVDYNKSYRELIKKMFIDAGGKF